MDIIVISDSEKEEQPSLILSIDPGQLNLGLAGNFLGIFFLLSFFQATFLQDLLLLFFMLLFLLLLFLLLIVIIVIVIVNCYC